MEITFHRAWAPLGVDRVWQLMRYDFYAGALTSNGAPALLRIIRECPEQQGPTRLGVTEKDT